MDVNGVFIRSGPSINNQVVGTQGTSSRGTVDQWCTTDPSSPRVYCRVAFDAGPSGWTTVEHVVLLAAPTSTPIDNPSLFVTQQYRDMLDREPDATGLAYWTNEITRCGGDPVCVADHRVDVAAAFFVEQEFQQTGAYIYRVYAAALARRPSYVEFVADHNQVTGGLNLDSDKTFLVEGFVQRQEFLIRYPVSTGGAAYIDSLLTTLKNSYGADIASQRTTLLNQYNQCGQTATQTQCRAKTLRTVAEDQLFSQAVYNRTFVSMQYFGYLRRGPDQQGFDFWLNVLNSQPNNYRGMVCAFITSAEYQLRFSSLITHTNQECQ